MATNVCSSLLSLGSSRSANKTRVHSCPSSTSSQLILHVVDGLIHSKYNRCSNSSSTLVLLHSTQASLLALAPNTSWPPLAALCSKDRRLIERYMDNSLRLLDVCALLRDALQYQSRYAKKVGHALHTLESQPTYTHQRRQYACMQRARRAFSSALILEEQASSQLNQKLKMCFSKVREMGNRLHNTSTANGSEEYAPLLAALNRDQTALISFFRLVLADHLPILDRSQTLWQSARLALLRRSTMSHKLRSKRMSGGNIREQTSLVELAGSVHSSVRALYKMVEAKDSKCTVMCGTNKEEFCIALQSTIRRDVGELAGRVTCLQAHVDDVYRVLLETRLAMLNSFPN